MEGKWRCLTGDEETSWPGKWAATKKAKRNGKDRTHRREPQSSQAVPTTSSSTAHRPEATKRSWAVSSPPDEKEDKERIPKKKRSVAASQSGEKMLRIQLRDIYMDAAQKPEADHLGLPRAGASPADEAARPGKRRHTLASSSEEESKVKKVGCDAPPSCEAVTRKAEAPIQAQDERDEAPTRAGSPTSLVDH